jgi:UTP--glucose-1-phosphate uridylyltransferase
MSAEGLRLAQEKMRAAGVSGPAVDVFSHYYAALEAGETGLILEDTIEPLLDPPMLSAVSLPDAAAREALSRTVVIKLNGGLGTSMGMDKAKSLLPVRGDRSFLDLICDQVRHVRRTYDVRLPLVLMNSFRTRADSLSALAAHPDIAVGDLPLDFLQNKEPKLRTPDLTPVSWPKDPSLEWCPPGHGDLYTAILASGVLDQLLAAGYRYASTSNSDNLGAAPHPTIAAWFAASGAPYAAEVCRRTPADRKGGHLAIRKSDHRLILRDTAQTAPAEMDHFTDEHRHPYFHTNNLWFDLHALHEALTRRGAVLGLPLIRNTKTVDPTDPTSPPVIQIETAMGAAIEVFEGAQALCVGRDRFLPVKTTNDLLLLRSDAYDLAPDATLRPAVQPTPLIDLDPTHYKLVPDFDARFPAGPPSLLAATTLTIRGDWTFGAHVTITGNATLTDQDTPDQGTAHHIPDGAHIGDG